MSPLTLYLAKFIGLFCVLMTAGLAARPREFLAAVELIRASPGLILFAGVVTLAAGVACVLGHNVWSGGALALVVTVFGWATLGKGVALILLTPSELASIYRALHYPERFRAMMLVGLVASAWLTIAAFLA